MVAVVVEELTDSVSRKSKEQKLDITNVENIATSCSNISKGDTQSINKNNIYASPQELFSTFTMPDLAGAEGRHSRKEAVKSLENIKKKPLSANVSVNNSIKSTDEVLKERKIQPNIEQPNIVQSNIGQPNIVQPNIVQLNIVQPNIVQPNIVQPNIVQPNIVQPNIVPPSSLKTAPVTCSATLPTKFISNTLSSTAMATPSRPVLLQDQPHPHGPYYYMNQSYVGYSQSHHSYPGFYGIPNTYTDPRLYYPSQNIYHKNEIGFHTQRETKRLENNPKISQTPQTFASIQGQMAANQIPLCLVQDAAGQLHQLVYTVPEQLYDEYVAAAAKGENVKVRCQLNNTKANDSVCQVSKKQLTKQHSKLHNSSNNDTKTSNNHDKKVDVPKKELCKMQNRCAKSNNTAHHKCENKKKSDNCLVKPDKQFKTNVEELSKNRNNKITQDASIPSIIIPADTTTTVPSSKTFSNCEKDNRTKRKTSSLEVSPSNMVRAFEPTKCSTLKTQDQPITNLQSKITGQLRSEMADSLKEEFLTIISRNNTNVTKTTNFKQECTSDPNPVITCIDLTNRKTERDKLLPDAKLNYKTSKDTHKKDITSNKAPKNHVALKCEQENHSRQSLIKRDNKSRQNNNKQLTESRSSNLTSIDDILSRKGTDLIPKSDVEELLRTLKRKLEESDYHEPNKKRLKCTDYPLKSSSYDDEIIDALSPMNCVSSFDEDNSNSLLMSRDMGSVSSVDSAMSYSQQSSVSSVTSENNLNMLNTPSFDQIFTDETEIDIDREIMSDSIFNSSSQPIKSSIVSYNNTNELNNRDDNGSIDLNFFDNFKENIFENDNLFYMPSPGNDLLPPSPTNNRSLSTDKQKYNGSMCTDHVSFPSGQPAADMDLFDHLWSELENI